MGCNDFQVPDHDTAHTSRAPWTARQVLRLNRFQRNLGVHPFTCGGDCRAELGIEAELVATRNGWICPTCDYTQDWAHAAMAGPA